MASKRSAKCWRSNSAGSGVIIKVHSLNKQALEKLIASSLFPKKWCPKVIPVSLPNPILNRRGVLHPPAHRFQPTNPNPLRAWNRLTVNQKPAPLIPFRQSSPPRFARFRFLWNQVSFLFQENTLCVPFWQGNREHRPNGQQIDILRKNHKNIQEANFIITLICRCRIVVLHFLKRIMAAKRLKKTQKKKSRKICYA